MAHLVNSIANFFATLTWFVPIGIALLGIILFITFNNRGRNDLRSLGLAAVGLAILLGVARFLIRTDAEMMEQRTRWIVDAADAKDWPKLQSLLDANTLVDLASQGPTVKGAKNVADAAKAGADRVKLDHVQIRSLSYQQDNDGIHVMFSAVSKQGETMDNWYPSGWEFDYQQHAGSDAWFLDTIKMTSLGNQSF